MTVTRNNLPDHENSLTKEWIVTNGIGGYASSTIIGTNTRRYHGILVAAFNPPTGRKVMVSKVEETLLYNNEEINVSTNQYPDAIHPQGYYHIDGFIRKPLPTTHFKYGPLKLHKTVFMVYNSNTTVIEYTNASGQNFILRLNPLYAVRDYHGLLHEQHDYKFLTQQKENLHAIYAYAGAEPLYFKHTKGIYKEARHWNKNVFYAMEKLRGHEFLEDLYSLGFTEYELLPGESMFLTFSLDPGMLREDPLVLKSNELARLNKISEGIESEFLADLLVSGDQFIVHRHSTENYSVIAGYHWFTDWGRDSMIALRGLCIATGRQKEARSIISTFLNFLKDGIIPNRFADYETEQPEYHTIDATLWLFIALYEYDNKFNDTAFLKSIYQKLTEIIDFHCRGTMNNIHVTDKGFLSGGTHGLPLTWMDARINDHVFTPRSGCPVEVNALWYNALKIHEFFSQRLNVSPRESFKAISYKLENNFEDAFWNEKGYLNDLISENGTAVAEIRPNQVYAVSLPFTPLPAEKQKLVLQNISGYLLTDYGLRTLSADDPQFKANYSGDRWARDSAYHEGTVWPYLLPEYLTAYLKINNHNTQAKKEATERLKKLKDHFYKDECLYGISEVFDGLTPRSGKGCIQQAWSVSNLILLLTRENIEL